MIPVTAAPEPADFHERVRRPGLDAIAELVGEAPSRPRPGPKRKARYPRREAIPPTEFPAFWRDVLPDMLEKYHRLCAYLSLYIEHATGAASVDHVIPKSKQWGLVYEWSNYRLACQLVNARKSDLENLLDPFEIEDGWFALEFVEFQVLRGPQAPAERVAAIEATIDKLGLNARDCCKAREEYVSQYQAGKIQLDYLERRAPFVARELRRQGKLGLK